ncbi:Chromosome II, complete genome, related [Eimeria maxima]|uniref:Chromosome II, complete genome, related n=1 Tax=Eimeria maxima TaxID=5804 RepID=U6MB07_EIMMA|nr:Chromosome II, complete genome, related [Eimeria maxima]CDJ58850.1 Chromosome II, complete genome, related [Eimeria maxima]
MDYLLSLEGVGELGTSKQEDTSNIITRDSNGKCSSSSNSNNSSKSTQGSSFSPCNRVYRLLQQIVQPEWHTLADPTSAEWMEDFNRRVAARESLTPAAAVSVSAAAAHASAAEAPASASYGSPAAKGASALAQADTEAASSATPSVGETTEAAAPPPTTAAAAPVSESEVQSIASAFDSFTPREQFLLLSKINNKIDTPWVQALRRLRAVEECETSRPLELNEVLNYARRLAGNVSAPPETSNVVDPVAHNAAFPRYHFLPYPSVEEMQASRLAALAARPYGEICFPPEVTAQLVYVHRKAAFSLIDTPKGRIPIRPLLVPGPFPKTVRVQCRKKEKKPSRITQSCLKLKGAAATAAASQGPTAAIAASRGQHLSDAGKGDRHAATDGQEGFRAANESTKQTEETRPAVAAAAAGQTTGLSQFHGLMLGTARRRPQQRREEEGSSESSSSSSSSDEGD